jgi:hypothetical protein
MAKNKRLSPNKLAELKGEFANLKTITDYTPLNDAYKVSAIDPVETALNTLLPQEAQIVAQLADIRDQIAAKGTEFAQKMKGARQQAIAQFGEDSPQIQSLGLKRSSEKLTGKRTKNGGNTPNG